MVITISFGKPLLRLDNDHTDIHAEILARSAGHQDGAPHHLAIVGIGGGGHCSGIAGTIAHRFRFE